MSSIEQRLKRLEEALATGGDFCACPDGRSIVFVDYFTWQDNPDRFWRGLCDLRQAQAGNGRGGAGGGLRRQAVEQRRGCCARALTTRGSGATIAVGKQIGLRRLGVQADGPRRVGAADVGSIPRPRSSVKWAGPLRFNIP